MTEPERCIPCDGNGWTSDRGPCPTCQGEGVIDPDRCTNCRGTGRVESSVYRAGLYAESRCVDCDGTGKYPEDGDVELPVFLPDEGNPREIAEGL